MQLFTMIFWVVTWRFKTIANLMSILHVVYILNEVKSTKETQKTSNIKR